MKVLQAVVSAGAAEGLDEWLAVTGTAARFQCFLADAGRTQTTAIEAQDLCEIIEERSINKFIAFTSQSPLSHWNEVITEKVVFDTSRDRLENSALTIHITGPTYRSVNTEKLASRKKGRA